MNRSSLIGGEVKQKKVVYRFGLLTHPETREIYARIPAHRTETDTTTRCWENAAAIPVAIG